MAASMFELLPHLITIFELLEYLWNLNTLLVEFYCNKSKLASGYSNTKLNYPLLLLGWKKCDSSKHRGVVQTGGCE